MFTMIRYCIMFILSLVILSSVFGCDNKSKSELSNSSTAIDSNQDVSQLNDLNSIKAKLQEFEAAGKAVSNELDTKLRSLHPFSIIGEIKDRNENQVLVFANVFPKYNEDYSHIGQPPGEANVIVQNPKIISPAMYNGMAIFVKKSQGKNAFGGNVPVYVYDAKLPADVRQLLVKLKQIKETVELLNSKLDSFISDVLGDVPDPTTKEDCSASMNIFQKALSIRPSATLHALIGYCYYLQDNREMASSEFQKAKSFDASNEYVRKYEDSIQQEKKNKEREEANKIEKISRQKEEDRLLKEKRETEANGLRSAIKLYERNIAIMKENAENSNSRRLRYGQRRDEYYDKSIAEDEAKLRKAKEDLKKVETELGL